MYIKMQLKYYSKNLGNVLSICSKVSFRNINWLLLSAKLAFKKCKFKVTTYRIRNIPNTARKPFCQNRLS